MEDGIKMDNILTPEQKIKKEILLKAEYKGPLTTGEEIEAEYNEENSNWGLQDFISEFREGQTVTDIKSEFSRNYCSKSVASKMSDGSWVGWTFWFGGGKHGCEEEIDWMSYSYDLDVEETEKTVIIQKWTKK